MAAFSYTELKLSTIEDLQSTKPCRSSTSRELLEALRQRTVRNGKQQSQARIQAIILDTLWLSNTIIFPFSMWPVIHDRLCVMTELTDSKPPAAAVL
eukprot:scaffold290499_cov19-Prasinocladus_malaysianus.AAC.1